jgi:hypothetical protein
MNTLPCFIFLLAVIDYYLTPVPLSSTAGINVLKTLQSIKVVHLQSFIGIGTSNQKLFHKLSNFSKRYKHSAIFSAMMWG